MNIFVTDRNPIISAEALDDKRVIKMILESAQIMSTVMHLREAKNAFMVYKPTHKGHPCTIWTNENRKNYEWLLNHFVALSREYTKRFNKIHKSFMLLEELASGRHLLPDTELSPFTNATKFKNESDVIVAYRMALVDKWLNDKRPPTWTNSKAPQWKEQYEQLFLQNNGA